MDLLHCPNSSIHLERTLHGKPYLAVREAPHYEMDAPCAVFKSVRVVFGLCVSLRCEEGLYKWEWVPDEWRIVCWNGCISLYTLSRMYYFSKMLCCREVYFATTSTARRHMYHSVFVALCQCDVWKSCSV